LEITERKSVVERGEKRNFKKRGVKQASKRFVEET